MTQITDILKLYLRPHLFGILLLGFVSGLPFVLVSSTLTIWLAKTGYSNSTIGWMFLTTLPYCLKFTWAPFIDRTKIPFLTEKFGQRRGFALFTQIFLILSILGLGLTDPNHNIYLTAFCAFILSFCSASQDIVLDAYRIERVSREELAVGTSLAGVGFRVGMLVGSAGTLYLASRYSWALVYGIVAFLSLLGPLTIFFLEEPKPENASNQKTVSSYFSILKTAVAEFTRHPEWALILLFILFYKASDAIPQAWSGPLLIELEFTTDEIASIVKTFGIIVMIIGGLLGGIIVSKLGTYRGILLCGTLQLLSPCMFMLLALAGRDLFFLTLTIAVQNFCCGMGNTAFVTYLSSLCSRKFTATQFSLIYSFSSFARIILSAGAGWIADYVEWTYFFFFVMLFGAPFLLIILKLQHKEKIRDKLRAEENKILAVG